MACCTGKFLFKIGRLLAHIQRWDYCAGALVRRRAEIGETREPGKRAMKAMGAGPEGTWRLDGAIGLAHQLARGAAIPVLRIGGVGDQPSAGVADWVGGRSRGGCRGWRGCRSQVSKETTRRRPPASLVVRCIRNAALAAQVDAVLSLPWICSDCVSRVRSRVRNSGSSALSVGRQSVGCWQRLNSRPDKASALGP